MSSSLDGFESFVTVCEAGSIAEAARLLDVSRATVSRDLARLEEGLGVRLLHRSTRRLVRTAAGEEFYQRAKMVLDAGKAARDAIHRRDDVPRGTLRLSVPPDLGSPITDFILSFVRRYPDVRLEVEASSRHVDLASEGFDIALRGGQVRDESLVARRLVHGPIRLYASPEYLDARGRPQRPEDLVDHECITMMVAGRPLTRWPLLSGGTIEVGSRVAVNTMRLAIDAVRNDLGIAFVPPAPFDGGVHTFEPVLVDSVGQQAEVSLVFVERALMLPRVRAFLDHLTGAMAEAGWDGIVGGG